MTTPLSGQLASFAEQLPFALDDFQQRACQALENGHGVLVCAPTGAGKTVVGEFAVHLALAAGRKCFYTTPIKALSNQKHNDLVARYGPERIGLLTGDQSINGDADVVVMTTEVLRNMLYANSPALHGLSHVVMDEVHFLADRMRGAVWEEVILHLPDDVRLVSLSATVSNAEEFGGWIQTVRGDTTVVVDEHRPVPLWQHVMVGKRLFDLFDYRASTSANGAAASFSSTRNCCATSPTAARLTGWPTGSRAVGTVVAAEHLPAAEPARRDRHPGPRRSACPQSHSCSREPGCDAAVKQCLRSSLRLTSDEERVRIAEISRPAHGGPQRGRPGGARLPRMARGPAARSGRPPRGNAADLPPHRRGTVHRRPGEGGIRHGDTGFGHQHAGPDGAARAAGQVQRRAAHAVDAGGVHPADRPRRPPRHRRRGPRRRAVDSRRRPGRGRGPGLHPHLPAAQFVRAVLQHDHQPGPPDGPDAGARSCWKARSRNTRPTARWSGWFAASSAASGCSTRSRASSAAATRRSWTTCGCACRSPSANAHSPERRGCIGARPPTMRSAALRRGRHHHHHPGPPRRPGRRAGTRPRQRRPAAARADRTPLGRADFVGRLLGRVGTDRLDAAAQACRTPQPAGAARSRVGAALGRRGPGRPVRQAESAAARPRNATSIRSWPALREQTAAPSRARLAGPRREGPAGRAVSADRTGQRTDPAEDRGGDQLAGAHVRPNRRVAHRARVHRRRRRRPTRR